MGEIFKRMALLGDVWVLWLLVGASIVSIAVICERWWAFRAVKGEFSSFLQQLAARLDRHDLDAARGYVRTVSSLEARVALAGLEAAHKGAASAQEAMDARLVAERTALERNLVILGTLGNNAPFIGLFGTVLGIIKAFHDLAASGSSGVAVVMDGIASALIATAFGIFVAIPAVMANNAFHAKLKRAASNAQTVMHTLQSHFLDERRPVAGAAGA